MIYVVTGQPRHGKSQYVIKMLIDFIADNEKRAENGKKPRKIYCDIAGINGADTPVKMPEVQNQHEVFGTSPLWFGEHDDPEIPEGYVCPEPASIFIYDECHKVDWIKDTSGMLSKHPTTISMNEHGHEDFILVLITQFPYYIHSHLRGLVEYHYHVKRFNGLAQSTIYKWNEFKVTPRAKSSMDEVYEKERFKFNKRYYARYASASAHDSMKFNLPREWVIMFLFIAAIGGFFAYTYYNSPVRAMIGGEEGATFNGVKGKGPIKSINGNEGLSAKIDSDEKAEKTEQQQIDLLKNEIDELKQKYLPNHIYEMGKDEQITPAVAVGSADNCIVTNRFGERLNVTDDLCRMMLADATMMPKSRSVKGLQGGSNGGSFGGSSAGSVEVKKVEPI